ncbi:MAG: tRNA threonylcarbamoyladenosine biosynthesis protein [Parcubacteria group bacterium Gr01-1014_2]|nr:MAG: tRNA threonylcarbamoyladenosine biosynthesis protein [Parcubacteria group bacterium Gr01-1014_2]
MKVIKTDLSGDFDEAIQEAIAVLKMGGTIVYPTDTLYALGANGLEIGPVERIFKVKQRPTSRPLPIAVKNMDWAKELAFIYGKEKKVLEKVWPAPHLISAGAESAKDAKHMTKSSEGPGQVTVVLPKRTIVPDILTSGRPSVAMRIINSSFVDRLLGKFGYPITSTSANISNELPSNKILDIIERFEKSDFKPDLIIDAGDLKESGPSTILDLTSGKPKILRVGLSNPKKLLELLKL